MAVKLGLTNENFKWIAEEIDCEPEMVIAVSKVECKREPFDKDGFPAILFERHVFYRNLPISERKEYSVKYPSICAKSGYGRGNYGSYSEQRLRFSKAFKLNPSAAMEGCSWGPFQELGENWEGLDFANVGELVDTMKNGLYGASVVFIRSIKMRGLNSAMKTKKFALIARRYNGAGYKQFNYDGQIEDQYDIAKRLSVDWDKIEAKAPPQKKKENQKWIGLFADPTVDLTPEEQEIDESKTNKPNISEGNSTESSDTVESGGVKNEINLGAQPSEIKDTVDKAVADATPKIDPTETIDVVTGKVQKYVPQDIQEQIKEGLITTIKGRAYIWIGAIFGGLSAGWTWFTKEGGWIYAIVLIALVVIGFQLYSWLTVWIKNRDRDRFNSLELERLKLEGRMAEMEHEKVMFQAKSIASGEMRGINFIAPPPNQDDVKVGDTSQPESKPKYVARGILGDIF